MVNGQLSTVMPNLFQYFALLSCRTCFGILPPCHAEFISASLGSTKTDPETDPQILKHI